MSEPKSNNFLASMKMASQRFAGAVADTGAKAMLKTDVVFLERDIAARKHALGVEIYDILQTNGPASSSSASDRVQRAFEECRSDIQHLEAKVNSKRGEMEAIDSSSGGGVGGGGGGVAAGGVGGMDDAETPGIPSTP